MPAVRTLFLLVAGDGGVNAVTSGDAASVAGSLAILGLGVAIVLGMILVLRLNAFFALITAALTVSLIAPFTRTTEIPDQAARVAGEFGATAGKIGISIAMAAVVGSAMTASGAADRLVLSLLRVFGQRRTAGALAASGYILSIPVFFDTVFYLLCPLAKSTHRRTGKNYLKYLLALGAGGMATHSLVPPTPGPLAAAGALGVDMGLMILVGSVAALPATLVGLAYAAWIDRRLVLSAPPDEIDCDDIAPPTTAHLPGLGASLAPIALPVVLIAANALAPQLSARGVSDEALRGLAVVGNPNAALMISALIAFVTYLRRRQPSRREASCLVEESLTSAGMIILITAAGGAFGAMLKHAGIGDAILALFAGDLKAAGYMLLVMAFGMACLMKLSQGSSTVAMITVSSMMNAIVGEASIGFHRVYLATAVGCGAMVASWMNDSGFWVFCKMGGLNESEGLRAWTPLTALEGLAGISTTIVLATLFPMV